MDQQSLPRLQGHLRQCKGFRQSLRKGAGWAGLFLIRGMKRAQADPPFPFFRVFGRRMMPSARWACPPTAKGFRGFGTDREQGEERRKKNRSPNNGRKCRARENQ